MKLDEAYSILNLSASATPEEAKKQYRKLTKEFHPDVNKEPGAEEKFKKINEAYQIVTSGKSTDREEYNWESMDQSFNPFGSYKIYHSSPINVNLNISFKESILGCQKEIKFNRNSKCSSCNGTGESIQNNGCSSCGGKGKSIRHQGTMIFIQECPKCNGRTKKINCNNCKSEGTIETEASVRVSVPGGIANNNILRLNGVGHYMGSFGPMEQVSDVHLHITVASEPNLSLEGTDVISTLKLFLNEAVTGCKKNINTINGHRDVDVPPKSRNKEEIIIPNLGVNGKGNQRVILDVSYPENIEEILHTTKGN